MVKIITLYNNKGGVSKTTTLFNLAVYLSQNNKKILIADCDPQCNVTELFFASSKVADDPNKELPGTSIYEALKPRFNGEVAQIDSEMVELVESELYENLYLLKGDINFGTADIVYARSWMMAITEDMYEKNNYISLYHLFQVLAQKYSFDYILCDVGPGTSAITRMVLLSCDGFFLSLTPDRFSNQAIGVIGGLLGEWLKRHSEITRTFEPFNLKSFPGNPTFLGAIILDTGMKRMKCQKTPYDKWLAELNRSISYKILSCENIPVRENLDHDNPFVATIPFVGTLSLIAQKFGCAIFDIEKNQYSWALDGKSLYGQAWQIVTAQMGRYRDEIKKLSEVLP